MIYSFAPFHCFWNRGWIYFPLFLPKHPSVHLGNITDIRPDVKTSRWQKQVRGHDVTWLSASGVHGQAERSWVNWKKQTDGIWILSCMRCNMLNGTCAYISAVNLGIFRIYSTLMLTWFSTKHLPNTAEGLRCLSESTFKTSAWRKLAKSK